MEVAKDREEDLEAAKEGGGKDGGAANTDIESTYFKIALTTELHYSSTLQLTLIVKLLR